MRGDDGTAALEEARFRALVGADVDPRRLPARASRAVEMAAAAGASTADALDAAIAASADDRRRTRALEVATAQARAVAGGLAALPVVAVPGIGALIGEPLWRFYLTPAGRLTALVGLCLAAVGLGLARVLVVRATRRGRGGADEIAELVAVGMAGGLAAPAALRAAAGLLPGDAAVLRTAALALEVGGAPPLPPDVGPVVRCLREAAAHGAPAVPALRRIAAELREEATHVALAESERLPARLAAPTALFLMPACVLAVGAPLVSLGVAAVGAGP